MRSIETEGAVGAVVLQAFRAAVREAFEIVEQRCCAAEAGEYLLRRPGAVEPQELQSLCVDEGETGDLPCALGDEQLHAMLDDHHVGFYAGASFRVGEDVVEFRRVFEAADEPVDVVARDFSEPRDGVEREQDAQESEEQLGHGWEYDPSFWPG